MKGIEATAIKRMQQRHLRHAGPDRRDRPAFSTRVILGRKYSWWIQVQSKSASSGLRQVDAARYLQQSSVPTPCCKGPLVATCKNRPPIATRTGPPPATEILRIE